MTLAEQVEAGFTYRGNVTITLKSGEALEAFLFNRDLTPHASLAEPPFVEVFLAGGGERRKLRVEEIAGVELTGSDPAAVSPD